MKVELVQSMWDKPENNEPHRHYQRNQNSIKRQGHHLKEYVTVSHNSSTEKLFMHTMQSYLLWMGIVLIVGLTGESIMLILKTLLFIKIILLQNYRCLDLN